LKERLLNSTVMKSCSNLDSYGQSILSESLADLSLDKLAEKVKLIEENFKREVKNTTFKLAGLKMQCRADLEATETAFKEQIDSGF
jgi:hypothetical protein